MFVVLVDFEVMTDVILKSYAIDIDSTGLKNKPVDFELLRSNYLYRNEPQAWDVFLENANQELASVLKDIGFNVHLT